MLIGSRKVSLSVVRGLVSDIKRKKELKAVAESFVKETIKKHLSENSKQISYLQSGFNVKAAKYKEIVKGVRKRLRRAHGVFGSGDIELRQKLFNQGKYLEILETHGSTKERLGFYSDLYFKLWKIIGKVDSILDLGCGLNPFSYSFMRRSVKYYAYDINEEEIRLVRKYFLKEGIKGKAAVGDVRQMKKFVSTDVAFLFKMTDVLESGKGHKKSEEVMKLIPAKNLVVSFPTITVSGKPMNYPRRKWMELMCKRLGWSFKVITEKNELFYVISK